MARYGMLINTKKCVGCYACRLACQAKNHLEPTEAFIKFHELETGEFPNVYNEIVPTQCQHCEDAPCMAAAPDAVYRRDDGLVIVDPEKAKGKRELAEACPYGAIFWNEELGIAQKCTGCAHLLDDGWAEPRCVDACCTGALPAT